LVELFKSGNNQQQQKEYETLNGRSMWDLAEDPVSIALLESFYNSGKIEGLSARG
jgi:hypothetical protein